MVDTIAAGLPLPEARSPPVLAAATLGAALVMAGALCTRRAGRAAARLAFATGLYLALSFPVFWWTGLRLPVTAPRLLVLLGFLIALLLRRNPPSPPEVSRS